MKLYVIFLIFLTWNFNALHIDCVINGLNSPHKPYSVYIEFTNSDGLWMAGAGSLIDNYKVLTSRNVVMHNNQWNTNFKLGFGNSDRDLQIFIYNVTVFEVLGEFAFIHLPNNTSLDIDSASIYPIRLPKYSNFIPLPNQAVFLVGFSDNWRTPLLQISHQLVLFDNNCEIFYDKINHATSFCAQDDRIPRSDACISSNGAGLVVLQHGQEVLVGVVVDAGCGTGRPTKYARTSFIDGYIPTSTTQLPTVGPPLQPEVIALFHVHIIFTSPGDDRKPFGGSFISDRVIVTSQSLSEDLQFLGFSLGFGSSNRSELLYVDDWVNIAKPSNTGVGYIVLDNPVAMGGNTMPIRIPSGNITSTQMPIENEIGYIVGFSDDNYYQSLIKIEQRVLMQGLCFNWYRDFNINTEFCTFDVVATMHECGRKGAGFVIKRDGIEILAGVLISPADCDSISGASRYSRVAGVSLTISDALENSITHK